jgi:hypothetical protein
MQFAWRIEEHHIMVGVEQDIDVVTSVAASSPLSVSWAGGISESVLKILTAGSAAKKTTSHTVSYV